MATHSFFIEHLAPFLANLEARQYTHTSSDDCVVYSKTLSDALVKHYAYRPVSEHPVRFQVTYELLQGGAALQKLTNQLATLNLRVQQALPGKLAKALPKGSLQAREMEREKFLNKHRELISCFRYEADNRLTEGNYSFNLQMASTTRELKICLAFVKALAEASFPEGIIRKRRGANDAVQQRNGWIKRFARTQRKRGWTPAEIVNEIQKELRSGLWNERARLQYNIANSTIGKIAGLKVRYPRHAPRTYNVSPR